MLKNKGIMSNKVLLKIKSKTKQKTKSIASEIKQKTKYFLEKIKNNCYKKLKNFFTFFKIDYSFLFLFVFALVTKQTELFLWFILFLIIHELSHFFTAKKLGYMAKQIHLSFFGASLEGLDDFNLKDEIKIILAGLMFNLSIIILCFLSFWFYPESYNYLYYILLSNLSIFLFNFLPIYPLDFGRIILAFLTKKYPRKKALKMTKSLSFVFILLLFLIFLLSFAFEYNFTLGLVCINLMDMLLKSTKNTSYKREVFALHKAKLIKKGLLERNIYIDHKTPHYQLFKHIDDYHFVNFFFLDESFNITFKMSEIELYSEFGCSGF